MTDVRAAEPAVAAEPAAAPITPPALPPVRWRDRVRGLLLTARIWRRTRTHRIRTLLCLLGFLAFAAVLTAPAWLAPEDLLVQYSRRAQQAMQANRWDAASLYYQHCLVLDRSEPGARYGLALASDKLGDQPRALALMTELAQGSSSAEPAARLWLVQRLLADGNSTSPDQLQAAQTHLERLTQLQPGDLQVQQTLGRVYARRGLVAQAVDQYRRLAVRQPAGYLAMASLLRSQKQGPEADQAAQRAIEVYRKRLAMEPRDLEARSGLATAHVLLDQFDEGEQVLKQGLKLAPDPALKRALAKLYIAHERARASDPATSVGDRLKWLTSALKRALAGIYVAHERARASDPATSVGDRLKWLTSALELVPQQPDALALLAELTDGSGADVEAARQALRAALAQGQAPAVVHMVLGTIASRQGDLKQSIFHYEQAVALDPRTPALANNLAWVLFQADKANADRSLKLLDQALESAPQIAELHATRGEIRLYKGQVREAIVDLEFALRRGPTRSELHELLADAYEQLGDHDLAAQHRKLQKPATGL